MKNYWYLIFGLSLGWLLHTAYDNFIQPGFQESSTPIDKPLATFVENNNNVAQQDSGLVAANENTLNNQAAEIDSEPKLHNSPQVMLQNNIAQYLQDGNFELAVKTCESFDGVQFENCRKIFLIFAESPDMAEPEKILLLDLWLAEYPDDIDAVGLMVQLDMDNERFVEAVQRMALLKSYHIDPRLQQRILRETQRFARTAMIKLTLIGDLNSLQALLVSLIEIEPERAAWRYSLAKAQYDLQQYDDALYTLAYILFDADYGFRSTQLYEEIKDKLNFAGYTEVLLRKVGSHYVVSARLNNFHPVKLLLDTGASVTSLNASLLESLGLTGSGTKTITLDTAGGRIKSDLITLGSLSIGGQVVSGLDVASLNIAGIEADGLLGMNFLNHFRFVIDQDQRKLYLERR